MNRFRALDWWCVMGDFDRQFAFGRVGEGFITQWLISHGASVYPVETLRPDTFQGCVVHPAGYMKGPHITLDDVRLVLPDLLVHLYGGWKWIEAKHKTCFTWHRKSRQWTTGIDLHHYQEYLHIESVTGLPVYLMFYHPRRKPDARDIAAGCPSESPIGMFCGTVQELRECENHRHENHGRHGMVYWAPNAFPLVYSI